MRHVADIVRVNCTTTFTDQFDTAKTKMRKLTSKPARRCLDCEIDCRCGCQSNIYSLPLEVIERILMFEDPLTLAALEKTSKFFYSLVADFWALYCKRNHICKKPTPLCTEWYSSNEGIYSYENAVEQVTDGSQRWRIMAIRVYLRRKSKCVICMSTCDDMEQNFLYGEDVLLCRRCLPHFAITVSHDLLHLLNSFGVDNSQFHINFGTILLCQFIKALKSSVQDGGHIFEQVQSYLSRKAPEGSVGRSSLPLNENMSSPPIQPRSLVSIDKIYFSNRQNCCCSVQQCSSSTRLTVQVEKPVIRTRQKPFFVSLGILNFVNLFLLIHCGVLMNYFQEVNSIKMTITNFVTISLIDMILLLFMMVYLIIVYCKRLGKRGWNQSFATTLQCFLLACGIVEIAQTVLARSYVNDYEAEATSFMKLGIARYNQSMKLRSKIDWIQREFLCCGYSGNATHDWSNSSVLFPLSCCQSDKWSCNETRHYSEGCVTKMRSVIVPMLTSFIWTSVLSSIVHLYFIIYICIMFNFGRYNVNLARVSST